MSIWKCGHRDADSWSGCSRTLCQHVHHRNSGIPGSWLWLTESGQRGPRRAPQAALGTVVFGPSGCAVCGPAPPGACASPGPPRLPAGLVTPWENPMLAPWQKGRRIWKVRRKYYKLYHGTRTQYFVECYITISLSRGTAQWEWTVVSLIKSGEMDKTLWTCFWYWTHKLIGNAAYLLSIGFSELCVES